MLRFVNARFLTVLIVTLLLQTSVEASVNLPLHHWTYEAIERLTALGIIDRAMVVTKPYSRKQAAKAVGQALQRIRENHGEDDALQATVDPLLDRLVREFRPELVDLGALSRRPGASSAGPIRFGGRLQTEVDSFQVGVGQVRLRENRGGEYYADGTQAQIDFRGWAEVADWAAFTIQPKFISNTQALGAGATANSHNLYMREIGLKLSAFNVALEIGRGTQWWGPGYHGSLLLTDHAFPTDMIKLGSDEPFKLPWVLKELGEWKINSFLTQLERNRYLSRAKVFGLRVSYLPSSWLELGMARLTQFDGQGRDQTFPQAVVDSYTGAPNQSGDADVNEQVMIDARVRIPHVPYLVPFAGGMQIYGELGSEDKWSKIPMPSRAAFLTGIYIPQLVSGGSTDLRIEYADTDYTRRKTGDHLAGVWYNNGLYTSGMRHRGFPLGHHMGTDGIDVFVRSTRRLTDNIQIGSNINYQERSRGLPVHEEKREASVDLTWWISSKAQFSVGYVYQRIHSPGEITSLTPFVESFPANVTSTNHFLWTNLAVEF